MAQRAKTLVERHGHRHRLADIGRHEFFVDLLSETAVSREINEPVEIRWPVAFVLRNGAESVIGSVAV
jgi:hypothetical protein